MRLLELCLCSAIVASAATAPTQITFYKDVLPVLQKDCQTCHRPGEAAPMSFISYDSTRPWAKAIKTAVLTKKMPPWYADPHYGKFSNDRSLSQAEINTLVSWADAGAPAGDPKAGPKPITWVEGWRINKPDVVLSMQKPFEVPASGTIDYQYIVIPTGFTEDKYVQIAEARPGNPALVHHIIAFIREPGNPFMKDAQPGVPFVPRERARQAQAQPQPPQQGGQRRQQQEGAGGFGDFLAGYAPGTMPTIMKPGQARLVKAGSDIVLQMHYTANGKAGSDISKIGIIFANDKPTERVITLAATNGQFAIPPGDPNYQVDSKITLQDDSTLLNMLPHMHFRGKDFEYRVTYPTGEKEVLLSVPHYDFNWQLTYDLAQPKVLPKGTVIECTAHYDNSANNPYNPDPTKEVHFGEQTWEEMMFGFFDVAVPMNKTAMDLMRPPKKAQPAQSGSSF
ncbi:MAG TPA: thiol-disulfide isomerase [Bryobacteraceae bacterium]|nr:thiol-disulfide isomerase [Bryobacteraceae bacterium]